MPKRKGDRRYAEIVIGLLFVLAGIMAVGSASIIFIVLGVIGLFMVLRQFDRSSKAVRLSRDLADIDDDYEEVVTAAPRVDQVYAHALDATRRAGLDPTSTHVLPIDVGVMAF